MKMRFLTRAQGIAFIEVRIIAVVAFEPHQFLVVKNKIRTLVESRQHAHRIIELGCQTGRFRIARGRPFAQFDQAPKPERAGHCLRR